MEDLFKLGKKLKHLREERKFTQEGVAIELGVATSTYSDYEREVLSVPSAVVVKATELYKVDLAYFYSLRGPVNITMNDHSSNGYVEQQHGLDATVLERMTKHMEERSKEMAELYARMLAFMDRFGGRGSGGGAE